MSDRLQGDDLSGVESTQEQNVDGNGELAHDEGVPVSSTSDSEEPVEVDSCLDAHRACAATDKLSKSENETVHPVADEVSGILEKAVVSTLNYLGESDDDVLAANTIVEAVDIPTMVTATKVWSPLIGDDAFSKTDTYSDRGDAEKVLKAFRAECEKQPWIEANVQDPCECGCETVIHSKGVNYKKTCSTCNGTKTVRCSKCGETGQRSCGSCGRTGKRTCTAHNCHLGKQRCWKCHGNGQVHVSNGQQSGYQRCNTCSGLGNLGNCMTCWGSGRVDCGTCQASGFVTCASCRGRGRILCGPCDATGKTTHGLSIKATMNSTVEVPEISGFNDQEIEVLLRQEGRVVDRLSIEKNESRGIVKFSTCSCVATKEGSNIQVRGLGKEAPMAFSFATREYLSKTIVPKIASGNLINLKETLAGMDFLAVASKGKQVDGARWTLDGVLGDVSGAVEGLAERLEKVLNKGQKALRWKFMGLSFALGGASLLPHVLGVPKPVAPTVVQLLLTLSVVTPFIGYSIAKKRRSKLVLSELGMDADFVLPVSFWKYAIGGLGLAALGFAFAVAWTPVFGGELSCIASVTPEQCMQALAYVSAVGLGL